MLSAFAQQDCAKDKMTYAVDAIMKIHKIKNYECSIYGYINVSTFLCNVLELSYDGKSTSSPPTSSTKEKKEKTNKNKIARDFQCVL